MRLQGALAKCLRDLRPLLPAPKDYDLWNRMGSKTHADYAYRMNNVVTEEVTA